MAPSEIMNILNYGLVLLYGLVLSVGLAGGLKSKKEHYSVLFLFIAILCLQSVCALLFSLEIAMKLYPLISHLPIYLLLVLYLKRPSGVALVSVLTAYFCCQLPRWVGTVTLWIFGSHLSFQLGYMVSIAPLYFLLNKYFVKAAHTAMSYSNRSLCLIGGLPLAYYLFDYAATVYTDALYSGIRMLSEFLPAVMAFFYVGFVTIYHFEVQKRNQIELHNAMLSLQLEQSENEITTLQQIQEQTATYRHDMRHHFAMLGGYLQSCETEKALQYIEAVKRDIESITPERYCENVSANLILSGFSEMAKKQGVTLRTEVNIPATIGLSETELCALLSNALENAVDAAASYAGSAEKQVSLNCQPHKGRLLILISNPHSAEVSIKDGLPQSTRAGHGFGVKSIKMIAEKHGGCCYFEPSNGTFTLRIVLPMSGCERDAACELSEEKDVSMAT